MDNFERVEDAERITNSEIESARLDQRIRDAKPATDSAERRYGELAPNATYEKNGYTYKTDDQGKTESVKGKLYLKEGARSNEQTRVGKLGQEGDEGGHLIATRFNGPADGFNLEPQDMNLNRGEWKKMENEWATALGEGKEVEVGIQPVRLENGVRPIGFEAVYQIDDKITHKIFYNEYQGEDKQWRWGR